MRRTSLRIAKPQQLVAGAKVANRARWGEPIQSECSAGANERAAGDFHPMLENSRKPCGKRVERRWIEQEILRRISSSLLPGSSGMTTTRSAALVGFKKRDDFRALLRGGEAAIGLHVVARNYLFGITDEAVERCPVPHQIRAFHRT